MTTTQQQISGERIRELRKTMGLSQSDFAERLGDGATQAIVSTFEQGKREMTDAQTSVFLQLEAEHSNGHADAATSSAAIRQGAEEGEDGTADEVEYKAGIYEVSLSESAPFVSMAIPCIEGVTSGGVPTMLAITAVKGGVNVDTLECPSCAHRWSWEPMMRPAAAARQHPQDAHWEARHKRSWYCPNCRANDSKEVKGRFYVPVRGRGSKKVQRPKYVWLSSEEAKRAHEWLRRDEYPRTIQVSVTRLGMESENTGAVGKPAVVGPWRRKTRSEPYEYVGHYVTLTYVAPSVDAIRHRNAVTDNGLTAFRQLEAIEREMDDVVERMTTLDPTTHRDEINALREKAERLKARRKTLRTESLQ